MCKCPICGGDTEHPINENSISHGELTHELECVNDSCGFRCHKDHMRELEQAKAQRDQEHKCADQLQDKCDTLRADKHDLQSANARLERMVENIGELQIYLKEHDAGKFLYVEAGDVLKYMDKIGLSEADCEQQSADEIAAQGEG